jgi:hypothetical protein
MSVKFIVLCEDLQTDVFIRAFLNKRFSELRPIESVICPPGKKSGEQWVREEFPRQLKAVRARNGTFRIACIDADTDSVANRKRQLDRSCADSNEPVPGTKDCALIIVPKRNIETWFAYLRGESVDETAEKPYRKYSYPGECKPDAAALFEMCHRQQKLREPAPDSLKEACRDYGSLKV